MKKTKQQKGITLIALIITIVVLLILAVVAIRAVQGDGIIRYAQNARDEYQQKAQEENTILQGYLDKLNENNPNSTESEDEEEFNADEYEGLTVTAQTEEVEYYTVEVVYPDDTNGYTQPTNVYTEVTDATTITRMQTTPQIGDCIRYKDAEYVYGLSWGGFAPFFDGNGDENNTWNITKLSAELCGHLFGQPVTNMGAVGCNGRLSEAFPNRIARSYKNTKYDYKYVIGFLWSRIFIYSNYNSE